MIEKIKKILGCKKNKELAELLSKKGGKKIHPEQITQWKNRGFHKSTVILLDALIECIQNSRKSN